MASESAELISEIKQVMEQYRREVPSGRRAWPEAIKSRVWRLNKMGLSLYAISLAIDIPYMTLKSWERKQKTGSFRTVTVKPALPATTVKPPTVKAPKTVGGQSMKPSTVVGHERPSAISLVHPSGIRVEGLNLDEALRLTERWLGT